MPADTVTLEREAVMHLLVEAEGVSDALAKIAGVYPTPLTDALGETAARVADQILGAWPDDDDVPSPRLDLYEAGKKRGRELLADLVPGEREEVGSSGS